MEAVLRLVEGRRRPRVLHGCLGLPAKRSLLFFLLLAGFALSQEGPSPTADPLPLRRIVLPPERVAAELERARQGVYVKLPRAEFEARVARAARAHASAQAPVRLLEARYQATLTGAALVGRAEYALLNPAAGAGLFPLRSFGLALRQARLGQSEAVLGELDGKSLAVLVEEPGRHTLTLAWSARGDVRPGGIYVSLRVPPCALQSLELELPADRSLAVPREIGLATPPEPGRRSWRLDCAGRSQIDFVIRQSPPAGEPPLVLARLHSEQTLAPGSAEAQFTAQLDVLRGAISEVRCACDPALRLVRVTAGEHEVESWEEERGAAGQPTTLIVRLRDRVTAPESLTLSVRGLSVFGSGLGKKAPAAGTAWSCPGLRVLDAVPRGETLVLRVPPDLQLADWNAGRFTLAQSAADPDGRQVLTLHGPGAEETGKPKGKPTATPLRPRARLRIQEPEFRARQQLWWQVGAADQTLTAHITYQVTRGKLFRLYIQTPAWDVEALELTARMEGRDLTTSELVRTWQTVPGDGAVATLLVDLHRGLDSTTPARLLLRLRRTPAQGPTPAGTLGFPVLSARGARLSHGNLAISVDPAYQATAAASEPPLTPETHSPESLGANDEPPWGRELPDFLYASQGQPVTGALTLRPRRSQVRARSRSQVQLAGERLTQVLEIEVQPTAGSPQTLELWLSTPTVLPTSWKTPDGAEGVRRVERIGVGSNLWRLVLAQPLRESLTLRAVLDFTGNRATRQVAMPVTLLGAPSVLSAASLASLTASGSGESGLKTRWDIPLPVILSAEPMDGEVALYFPGGEQVDVEARGLAQAPAGPRGGGPMPLRVFHYAQPPVSLTLRDRPASDHAPGAFVESAQLTTTVQHDGQLVHGYTCRLWDWRQRLLPMMLPAEARVLALRVNGRWQVPPEPRRQEDGRALLDLPVPTGAAPLQLEAVYSTAYSPGILGARLAAPLPELPVAPIMVRRTWRLPPGIVPLAESHFLRLPGPIAETTAYGLSWVAGGLGGADPDTWPVASWGPAHTPRRVERQRLELTAAATRAWSKLSAPERRLGALLHAVALDTARTEEPLIVDAWALSQANVGAFAHLPDDAGLNRRPPWECVGVVHVPCRSASLLTTVQQRDTWSVSAGMSTPEPVASAVAEAVRHGRDASGRFRRAVDWLREQNENLPQSAGLVSPPFWLEDWTEWEPFGDHAAAYTLTVVQQDALPGTALALAGIVLFGAWGSRNWPAAQRYGLLLACLALGGAGLLWLPTALRLLAFWPVLATVFVAMIWYLSILLAARRPPRTTGVSSVTAAAVFLALAGTLSGQVENATPATVWLLPAPAGATEKGDVLASPALLNQLAALARRGVAALDGAILLDARYEGEAAGATVDILAHFRVHCFADEADLLLPLTGVELCELLLDGAPAFPTAPAGQTGYVARVKGRGPHLLQARFRAQAVTGAGGYELRVGVPRLVQSRLVFRLAEPAATPRVILGPSGGAQQTAQDGQSVQLNADLGRTNTLHVRWQSENKAKPPLIDVQEAYLWRLRATDGRLQGVLQYMVRSGAVATLALDLPATLEVSRVEAGSVPQHAPAPRLTGWAVERQGRRRLRLDFQYPVTDAIRIEIELIPTQTLGPIAALTLPAPAGTRATGSHVGVIAEGVQALVAEHLRLTATESTAFLTVWKSLGMPDPGPLMHHFTFRRGSESAPILRLNLTPIVPRLQAAQSLWWRIGPRYADLHAEARLTAVAGEELVLAEWEVPGLLTLAEVRGPNVRNWATTGNRVQVWFQRGQRETPLTETTLELTGWLPRPPKETPFTIPRVRLSAAPPPTTIVRLGAWDGHMLETVNLKNLVPLPDPRSASLTRAFVARDDNYSGTFRLLPASAGADARGLTVLEVREGRLHFVTTFDIHPRQGDLRTVVVRLRNWEGTDVRLEAAHVANRREVGRDLLRRSWVLDLAPGVSGPYQVRLSGSRPLSAGTLAVPDVNVAGLPTERWLTLNGSELQAESVRGLRAGPSLLAALAPWAMGAEHLRRAGNTAWKIETPDWQLRLRARPPASATSPAFILWAEHAAARAAGGRWLCESTFLLSPEAATHLSLHFPARTTVIAATLDHQDLAIFPGPRERLGLALPAAPGARTVRVRWLTDPRAGFGLDAPRLEGTAQSPAFWTVHVPPGYTVHAEGVAVKSSGSAALELHRAAAQVRLSALLAGANRTGVENSPLQAAQERFYRQCAYAEELLDREGEQPGAGPGGQSLMDWLHELREQNRQLARDHDFERQRARAERDALTFGGAADDSNTPAPLYPSRWRAGLLTEHGLPTYWEVNGGPATALRLDARDGSRAFPAAVLTMLFVAVSGVAWQLRRYSGLFGQLQLFWPEQAGLAGLVLWLVAGWPFVGAALLATAALGRALMLGRWWLAFLHARQAVSSG